MKILLVTQVTESAISYFRLIMPHAYMDKYFKDEYHFHQIQGSNIEDLNQLTDEQIKEYQIVFFQREINHRGTSIKMIERCKKLGCKVVLDVDDYWCLPKWHALERMYNYYKVSETTVANIKAADHVITTNSRLADYIKPFNDNVYVVANCIDKTNPQYMPVNIDNARMRFGWIGGVFHYDDIEPLHRSFQKLWKDKSLTDKWQLAFTFNDNKEYRKIERIATDEYRHVDFDYENYLKQYTNVSEHYMFDKPYRRLWGRNIHTYAHLYNNIDVALIPLRDNLFNRCKSELKVIEAAHMGKAVIVNDMEVYNGICDNSNSLLIGYNKPHREWYEAIKKYINNPELVLEHKEKLWTKVNEHFDIDKISQQRKELYEWIIK